MTMRIASMFITLCIGMLAGCADREAVIRHYTSAQITATGGDSDMSDRPLTQAQVTALSSWINARGTCSGMSANIPDAPSLTVQLQDTSGQSSHLDVYKRDDGSATAYLYQGHRIAPMRCALSIGDLAALKSALTTP